MQCWSNGMVSGHHRQNKSSNFLLQKKKFEGGTKFESSRRLYLVQVVCWQSHLTQEAVVQHRGNNRQGHQKCYFFLLQNGTRYLCNRCSSYNTYPHYVLVAKVNNARLYPVFNRIQQGPARLRKETAESIT